MSKSQLKSKTPQNIAKNLAYIGSIKDTIIDQTELSLDFIELLKQIYHNDQIVLDLEIIDENAENIDQRKSRKQFYLRNGYHESNYYMTYSNMTFELLCNSLPFQKQDFINLLETIKSPHFQPIVYLKERGNIL